MCGRRMSVATFHLGEGPASGEGRFVVRRGRRPLARLAALALGLPAAGSEVPVRVRVEREVHREVWRRWFGGRLYRTEQRRAGARRIERIGILEISYRLLVTDDSVLYAQEGASLRVGRMLLRLPRWMAPRVSALAVGAMDVDGFFITVSIRAPLVGPLLAYAGYVDEEVT